MIEGVYRSRRGGRLELGCGVQCGELYDMTILRRTFVAQRRYTSIRAAPWDHIYIAITLYDLSRPIMMCDARCTMHDAPLPRLITTMPDSSTPAGVF
jgi:hypothetical protein